MTRISFDLNVGQLERALSRLSADQQLRLAKFLAARQMEQVVQKLRRTAKRKKLSSRTIKKIVDQVRTEVHNPRRH